jgi:hypothetical protein
MITLESDLLDPTLVGTSPYDSLRIFPLSSSFSLSCLVIIIVSGLLFTFPRDPYSTFREALTSRNEKLYPLSSLIRIRLSGLAN